MANLSSNTLPTVAENNLVSLLDAEQTKKEFATILKDDSPTFLAGILEYFRSDTAIQHCNPIDLIAECKKAAILGLPVNKFLGQAYIISYGNRPQFQIGYKGLIQLAMRTNFYKTINTDVVYEGELRYANKLTGEFDFNGQRLSDRVIGYFAYFELKGGFAKTLYMNRDAMIKHALKYSASLSKYNYSSLASLPGAEAKKGVVGWLGNFDEMAQKTVLRLLLSKYGYLTLEMQQVLSAEDEQEVEITDEVPASANSGETVGFQEVHQQQVPPQQQVVQQPMQPTPQQPVQQGMPQQGGQQAKPSVFNRR
ncbi:MAG: recombinase RecT [Bacteroidales bacterium]|nr:recombinase RecT [Bacteroidales bacterium]